jgi:hypothetical protein
VSADYTDLLIPFYQQQRDERPNVLILMTDQQRWDSIKALGAPWMITPHLDRLDWDFYLACGGQEELVHAVRQGRFRT